VSYIKKLEYSYYEFVAKSKDGLFFISIIYSKTTEMPNASPD